MRSCPMCNGGEVACDSEVEVTAQWDILLGSQVRYSILTASGDDDKGNGPLCANMSETTAS